MRAIIISGIGALFLSASVYAGSGLHGVTQVGVMNEGGTIYALVTFDSDLSEPPSCASAYTKQVSFIADNEFGKLMYSTALAALTAQKTVYINYSASSCELWGNRTSLSRIDIKQ